MIALIIVLMVALVWALSSWKSERLAKDAISRAYLELVNELTFVYTDEGRRIRIKEKEYDGPF